MDLNKVHEFLLDLKFNNTRNWFKQNEQRYREAKSEFEHLVDLLIRELKAMDKEIDVTSSKECIFRIFRDVRFSKNKEPYKTNLGAFISRGGRKSPYAGYYLHFEPDNSFAGGGIYAPEPVILKAIRERIYHNTDDFKKIIDNKVFKNYFPGLYGERLTLAPKGFPSTFKDIDLLKYKHYAVMCPLKNSFWEQKNILENLIKIFNVQKPFNQFLNSVVETIN